MPVMTFFCEKAGGAKYKTLRRIKTKFRMRFISPKHKNKHQRGEQRNLRMLKY
jgi:hypothetical protein